MIKTLGRMLSILLLSLTGCINPAPASLPATTSQTIYGSAHTPTPFQPAEAIPGSMTGESPVVAGTAEAVQAKKVEDLLKIRIVYNNIADDPRLVTDWGFGATIEYHDQIILFDTGTDGRILLQNMAVMGIDPASVQAVVLSRIHNDHTGGLSDFLAVSSQPPVYLLSAFGANFINEVRRSTAVIETTPGQVIGDGILTTGAVSGNPSEQALILRTPRGMVIVTGCAHPGIVQMVGRAVTLTGDPVHLVLGGFHLGSAGPDRITMILNEFRRLGVEKVAPSHCTGEEAIRLFADAYGEDFLPTGVGSIITIGAE
ncbi:MAG: MBL fold metallo-hydrolase [Anaerolineaceae bacterium]|nr:MBL fold metallo-hydrolase [Anaerolineaceae bacterium]